MTCALLTFAVHVGTGDDFYKKGQLLPEDFTEAAKNSGKASEVEVNLVDGYDHSYYFIQTFGPEHIAFHAKHLLA